MESALPLWIILTPLIGAVSLFLRPKDDSYRNRVTIATGITAFILLLVIYKPVMEGGVRYSFSFLPGQALTFKVDPTGWLIALVTSFLWIIAHIFAISDMTHEKGNRLRFDFSSLCTLAANLGVMVAGDYLTLYIFYEGLIFLPYPLIAHREDESAIKGANLYLYVGFISSLALIAGIVLLKNYTGSLAIQTIPADIANAMTPSVKYQIAALMIIGFGGKAGIFGEHFWLAEAHPVAPSPGHALLSGAMIKAGSYGILRVVCQLLIPQGASVEGWLTLSNIGYVVIFVGLITMISGVLSALITSDYKRMLAFHSVSQMGYIILGIGCAAYLGKDGAMGVAGAVYHTFNHALFKVALLLGGGAVYHRAFHEQDMYKFGGLWRNMPLGAVFLFIAAASISGIPFFNGFASKSILHHAVAEAYEHGHDPFLKLAEVIFVVVAAGTFASNMKFFKLTFLGERPKKYENLESEPLPMKIALGALATVMVFVGLFPNLLLDTVIGPGLAHFGLDPTSHAYRLLYDVQAGRSNMAILYPNGESFGAVLHNLVGAVEAIVLGIVFMYVGFKYDLFHIKLPKQLTFVYYFWNVLKFFTEPKFDRDAPVVAEIEAEGIDTH